MALTNWIGTFGRAQNKDIKNDLERGYEAALLIQSLELEYYGDRPVRPDLELTVPRSVRRRNAGKTTGIPHFFTIRGSPFPAQCPGKMHMKPMEFHQL